MAEKQSSIERIPIEDAVELDGQQIEELYNNMHVVMDEELAAKAAQWNKAKRAVAKVIPAAEGRYQIGELGEVKVKIKRKSAVKAQPEGTQAEKTIGPLTD